MVSDTILLQANTCSCKVCYTCTCICISTCTHSEEMYHYSIITKYYDYFIKLMLFYYDYNTL